MTHPNAELLKTLYTNFSKGDLPAVLSACDNTIRFEIPGHSMLAGKYSKETFPQFAAKIFELSSGTFKTDIHELFASDRHAIVLATDSLTRGGKSYEYRTVHVWRFEGNKPIAFYEYPRDLYAFDEIWRA